MGMDVDKARGDQLAPRIDLLAAFACDLADLTDAAVADRDIGLQQLAAAAVSDSAAADHEVWIAWHDVSSPDCLLWLGVSSAQACDCQPRRSGASNASSISSFRVL